MQLNMRCFKCSTPFVIKSDEVNAALDQIQTENLKHYNAHCPRCGRANKVSKKQLRQAAPNWKPTKNAPAKKTTAKKSGKKTAVKRQR